MAVIESVIRAVIRAGNAQAELEALLEASDIYATRRIFYMQNLKPS